MFKGILGTIVGLVAATVLVFIVQKIGQYFHPMPTGLDLKNKAAVGAWISALPASAFLWLLAGYALGTFAGGATAAWVSGRLWPSIVIGAVLLLMGIANYAMIPHPAWVVAISLAMYVPLAAFAGHLVLKG